MFIDYGNGDSVSITDLIPLPDRAGSMPDISSDIQQLVNLPALAIPMLKNNHKVNFNDVIKVKIL